jgi:hypothetical protein
MIIKIDAIPTQQIAYRAHRARYYYTVAGFPNLLLVAQGSSLEQLQGKKAILLWNYDSIDSSIVCDAFPDAPQAWRNERIIQASISIKERMKGDVIPLSEALQRGLKMD